MSSSSSWWKWWREVICHPETALHTTCCSTTGAVTAQTHWDCGSCAFGVFFLRSNCFFGSVCPKPHPCLMKGEKERGRGGCSHRLIVHTEREHRPTVAAPWFICHLVLMKLQTAVTHTCCHGIFLHQSLVGLSIFASCSAASACTRVSGILCASFYYSYIFLPYTVYLLIFGCLQVSYNQSSFYLYPVCRLYTNTILLYCICILTLSGLCGCRMFIINWKR